MPSEMTPPMPPRPRRRHIEASAAADVERRADEPPFSPPMPPPSAKSAEFISPRAMTPLLSAAAAADSAETLSAIAERDALMMPTAER